MEQMLEAWAWKQLCEDGKKVYNSSQPMLTLSVQVCTTIWIKGKNKKDSGSKKTKDIQGFFVFFFNF